MKEDSKKVGLSVNEMISKFRQDPILSKQQSEDGSHFKKSDALQTQDLRSSKKKLQRGMSKI
jgi:hypothetical protein